MLADGSSTEEIGSGAVPQPAHRAQPRPQHPHEAARPDEARSRRHRGTRGIGRSAPGHVRSLRTACRVDRAAGVRPGVRRRLSHLAQRPDQARNDSATRHARSPRTWPSSTTSSSATPRRCCARSDRSRRTKRARAVRRRRSPRSPVRPLTYANLFVYRTTGPSSAARSRPAPTVDPETTKWLDAGRRHRRLRRPGRTARRERQGICSRSRSRSRARTVRSSSCRRPDRARRAERRRFDGVRPPRRTSKSSLVDGDRTRPVPGTRSPRSRR